MAHLFEQNLHVDPWDARWSRLISPYTVISSYSDPVIVYVCLFPGSWGCIAHKVSEIGDGVWKLGEDLGPIQVIHVCTHEWWVARSLAWLMMGAAC